MKTNLFAALAILTFNCFITVPAFSQNFHVSDSLTMEWEQLDGPPGFVFRYAEMEGKLFAGTEGGLFTSSNGGATWKFNNGLGRKRLLNLCAMGETLFVLAKDESILDKINVFKSNDKGQTWEKSFDTGALHLDVEGRRRADIQVTNDSIVSFIIYTTGNSHSWYSLNKGASWVQTWSPARRTFGTTVIENTIVGFWRYPTQGSLNVFVIPNGYFNNPQIIAPNGLPPIPDGSSTAVFQNGKCSIIQQNRTIHQSTDLGNTWTTGVLPVSDTIREVLFHEGFFYLRTFSSVWKGTLDAPFNFSQFKLQPGELVQSASSISFLNSGIWVNTSTNNTIYSPDNGNSWQERSKGLVSKVANIAGYCGKVLAKSEGGYTDQASLSVSQQQDGEWQSANTIRYKRILGEANGVLFAYPPALRSFDCGSSWDTIQYPDIHILAAPQELIHYGNRLYLWNTFGEPILFSDNNGSNWLALTNPFPFSECNGFIPKGDTLLFLSRAGWWSRFSHRSYDHGASWDQLPMPDYLEQVYAGEDGKLIAVGVNDISLGQGMYQFWGRIYVSNDLGLTWNQTFLTKQEYPKLPYQDIDRIRFPLVHEGMIIMHAADGVYVSHNEGVTWTRLNNLPFSNFAYEINTANTGKFVEGGISYMVDEGFLYASTESQGIWRTPFAPVRDHVKVKSQEYGFLSGRLFKDADGDCLFDHSAGDKPTSYKPVVINPGNILTNADGNGYYSVALPLGDYTITADAPTYHQIVCSPDTVSASISLGNTVSANFPFAPIPDVRDLCLLITNPTPSRPGFETIVKMQVSNVGTTSISGAEFNFVFDDQWLEPVSIAPFGQFSGNSASVSLPDLAPGEVLIVTMVFRVMVNTSLGTPLVFTAECPLSEDANPNNNLARSTQIVQGSYDPNDKNALPLVTLPPGQPRVLDFLIRFQNTGTDTAFSVVVTDTLQAGLNLLSLRTVEASHEFQFSFLPGRVCIWRFRNILLPDSNTNEAASHGYLRFQIETEPDLLPGSPIRNDADIFFDFNSPVRTNEAATENPKWLVTEVSSVVLCAGDTWNGLPFHASETLVDTMGNAWSDTITVVMLEVLPTYQTHIDTALAVGGLLFNTMILQDTTFSFALLSAEGCDSTVVWHVTATSSGLGDLPGKALQFELLPNPAAQEAWLVWNTAPMSTIQADIKLFNTSGMLLRTWDNKVLSAAMPCSIEVADLPSGVYFILVQSGNFSGARRLAKL